MRDLLPFSGKSGKRGSDMKVIVLSREQARQYALEPHGEKSIVVSINDLENSPNDIAANANGNGIDAVKWFFFDDVEAGHGVINFIQAREIAQFVLDFKDRVDLIIVHCGAGVSRSAGCAAAILKALNGSDDEIFGNEAYRPNMKVYRTVLGEFYRMMGKEE
jgi:predicted protein tyrosine phosphatase